jgi:hypothetical protein
MNFKQTTCSLKRLIADVDRVYVVHVKCGLNNDWTAIHDAIKNDSIETLKILLEDLKSPKKIDALIQLSQ